MSWFKKLNEDMIIVESGSTKMSVEYYDNLDFNNLPTKFLVPKTTHNTQCVGLCNHRSISEISIGNKCYKALFEVFDAENYIIIIKNTLFDKQISGLETKQYNLIKKIEMEEDLNLLAEWCTRLETVEKTLTTLERLNKIKE